MNRTDLTYIPYLNGYIQSRKLEQITWLDVFNTLFSLWKINIKILSYNLKAIIQHTWHLDFGIYLPSNKETFFRVAKMLKTMRNKP